MKKVMILAVVIAGSLALQNCKTTQTAQVPVSGATVSYQRDILPMMNNHCGPCHASPDGKIVHLDNYDNAKREIHSMIKLVSLPHDDPKFMPFKNKKPALSDTQIAMLKKWRDEGMAK